jgi:hypothetical protein
MRYLPTAILLLASISSAWAQRPDTGGPRRADSLRQRVEERFSARVQERLGLTDDQTARLKATSQTYGTRRRELRDREHRIRDALRAQLQPGVSANRDSVTRLTDGLIELKLQAAQAAREEMKELSTYLNPVQRARLYLMREQLYRRVKAAHGYHGRGRRERHRGWM